ncbi:DUF2336 domain-containing protein [Phreatobacter stygius]|uniref:DUF2336 domain-containing protein n=1 Tax=Phreatobacter stygius TaxID=1940610 RepID=A0A4D7B1W2_9HYPH|nr:DUF2336 domain-containing protein [Phreatobacter stygius]QCI64983.1 DUF2336 domain-containing protein [Phreatobacter stygius]
MPSSLDSSVESVLVAIDRLPAEAQQALVADILEQMGTTGRRLSSRARAQLDHIVAHLLPRVPIAGRLDFARDFGALDYDLPAIAAAVEADGALIAEIMRAEAGTELAADGPAVRLLGQTRRFLDMRIIAARADLTAEAAEALAEAGDARTIRALASNCRAPLPARALNLMLARASHDRALQEHLCARTDLDGEQVRRLVGLISDQLKARLYEKLDRAVVTAARQSASDATSAKARRLRLDHGSEMTTQEVRDAVQAGALSLGEAVTLLSATDRALPAMDMLTVMLDLDHDAVLATLGRTRIEPFEAIARALGLDEQVYLTLIAAIHRRWRKPMPDPRFLLGRYRCLEDSAVDARLAPLHRRDDDIGTVEQFLIDIPDNVIIGQK